LLRVWRMRRSSSGIATAAGLGRPSAVLGRQERPDRAPSLVGRLARLGCSRIGSPGILGERDPEALFTATWRQVRRERRSVGTRVGSPPTAVTTGTSARAGRRRGLRRPVPSGRAAPEDRQQWAHRLAHRMAAVSEQAETGLYPAGCVLAVTHLRGAGVPGHRQSAAIDHDRRGRPVPVTSEGGRSGGSAPCGRPGSCPT